MAHQAGGTEISLAELPLLTQHEDILVRTSHKTSIADRQTDRQTYPKLVPRVGRDGDESRITLPCFVEGEHHAD